MSRSVERGELDLGAYLRRGDRIVIGQACGEPCTLVEALIAEGRNIGGLSAFTGSSFSGLFTRETRSSFALSSMGAIGSLRALAKSGSLDINPMRMSEIGAAIESGAIGCDVAMVQVSAADENGNHSCGLVADYVRAAVGKARVVIAEVNAAIPFTCGEGVHSSEIDVVVPVNRPPVEVVSAMPEDAEMAIARHCGNYIGDGAVLQTGVGSLPETILGQVADRKDLGIHSGMIGDSFVALLKAGAVTNARKEVDAGISVTGALVGTTKLYDFAEHNPLMRLCAASHTHSAAVLDRISRFVAINSALEVDLTGQVNAESVGGVYLGAKGGHLDFARAAARSPGGCSIIALPAATMAGSRSRIVSSLGGPVTTECGDVDVVVTDFGAAELKGCSLAERVRRMIAIAHPDFREELDRLSFRIAKRGR